MDGCIDYNIQYRFAVDRHRLPDSLKLIRLLGTEQKKKKFGVGITKNIILRNRQYKLLEKNITYNTNASRFPF